MEKKSKAKAFPTLKQPRIRLFLLLCMAVYCYGTLNAQKKSNGVVRKSVSTSISSNYKQVGNTLLYYYQSDYSIDFMGVFDGQYYGCTFSNGGFRAAMQVGSNDAEEMDCLNGTTLNGVTFAASVEQQGDLARICYNVTNTNERDTIVSLGIHADIMIGNNDRAPISKRIDTTGRTYGLTLMDGNGAQLCALFGSGLKGVTGADDYWFGYYYQNNYASQMVGDYTQGDYWMVENGSYDSGMGICWKNRTIPAGGTVTFSWLIGVGDVNLEPSSSFEVTPDDPEGWNDLSRPHRLTLEGEYESPAGLDGMIEYAVENSEEWLALTDTLASGSTFNASLVANFDATLPTHTIRFRTVDNVGNATLLPSIEYKDVSFISLSGIEDKTYTGESLYQTSLTCDLADTCYVATNYQNNVNAGVATFSFEGVFPYTIGRKQYSFTINPAPLQGSIELSAETFIYNGEAFLPEFTFTESKYTTLSKDTDYVVVYENNILPGTGCVKVKGIKNYTDSLYAEFFIDKAQLSESLYTLTLPNEDISYDGETHEATIDCAMGVGDVSISYTNSSGETVTAPMDEGSYNVYLEIADGTLYYGKSKTFVGSFTIYNFDETEWETLTTLYETMSDSCGWTPSWNLSQGAKAVSTFEGLQIEKGHIVGINFTNKNLTAIPTDISAFAQLKSLNLSHNNLTGNASVIAALFTDLTSLDLSYNKFSDLYPMISSNVTTLDISHQNIDKTVDLDIINLDLEILIAQIPTIVLYDHKNQSYSTDINLICTTSKDDTFDYNNDEEQWAMQVLYKDGLIAMPYISQQNTYYGESGDTLKVFALDMDNNLTGSSFNLRLTFERGDANFNGSVDILDVQSIINYIFNEYKNRPFNFTAANLWTDDMINIQDAICCVNLLLEENSASAQAKTRAKAIRTNEVINAESSLCVVNEKLILNSVTPVAAFDIILYGASAIEMNSKLKELGFMVNQKQNDGYIHFIGYSLNGSTIPIGEFEIATVKADGCRIEAMISDRDANEIKCSQSQTTAIKTVTVNSLSGYDIYTLSGKKISPQNVTQGHIYIISSNGHFHKVIITK